MLVLLPLASEILVIIFLNQLVSKNLQIVYTGYLFILSRSCYNEAGREVNALSMKGFRYQYHLKSHYPTEYEAVLFAYSQVGWKEVGFLPDEGFPTHIIFEWEKNTPPLYPAVNWDISQR